MMAGAVHTGGDSQIHIWDARKFGTKVAPSLMPAPGKCPCSASLAWAHGDGALRGNRCTRISHRGTHRQRPPWT